MEVLFKFQIMMYLTNLLLYKIYKYYKLIYAIPLTAIINNLVMESLYQIQIQFHL